MWWGFEGLTSAVISSAKLNQRQCGLVYHIVTVIEIAKIVNHVNWDEK